MWPLSSIIIKSANWKPPLTQLGIYLKLSRFDMLALHVKILVWIGIENVARWGQLDNRRPFWHPPPNQYKLLAIHIGGEYLVFVSSSFVKVYITLSSKNIQTKTNYRKVVSSNTSRLEGHAGIFRLLMKGIFDDFLTKSWFPK